MNFIRINGIYTDLPVNPEIVTAVIENPDVTYDDLRSICASVENAPEMGIGHPLIYSILYAMGEIVLQELYR